ncbi:enoyl-CoA hydratase/isomerase family protein [Vulcanisaeta thermophila]|uniref:enoyl-CoA hydratase/isomerase family protein n=1 Tax=Vulcanisaeta thermophila TaxID=867917 RepID=UPI00085325B4|nr:enoyl-CoA hydratase/isomerase family protein [Vulcanisaeta thermophila]
MSLVIRESRDDVLIIRLNRPEKRNAFSLELTLRVTEAVRDGCGGYAGLIITGVGGVFSAGLDLAEIYSFKDIEESRKYFRAIKDLALSIINCDRPVVGLVNGSAYGFAAEILYFMDQVVAVKGSEFSLPGIRYGLVPVTPAFAPYLFGILRSRFFLDRDFKLSTEDALSWGLVHRVVGDINEGMEVALGIVRKINAVPRGVYLELKKLMIRSVAQRVNDEWDELLETLARESLTQEVKARLREFLRR